MADLSVGLACYSTLPRNQLLDQAQPPGKLRKSVIALSVSLSSMSLVSGVSSVTKDTSFVGQLAPLWPY